MLFLECLSLVRQPGIAAVSAENSPQLPPSDCWHLMANTSLWKRRSENNSSKSFFSIWLENKLLPPRIHPSVESQELCARRAQSAAEFAMNLHYRDQDPAGLGAGRTHELFVVTLLSLIAYPSKEKQGGRKKGASSPLYLSKVICNSAGNKTPSCPPAQCHPHQTTQADGAGHSHIPSSQSR